jgi:hypothetical protein
MREVGRYEDIARIADDVEAAIRRERPSVLQVGVRIGQNLNPVAGHELTEGAGVLKVPRSINHPKGPAEMQGHLPEDADRPPGCTFVVTEEYPERERV